MKNLKNLIFVSLVLVLSLTSCKDLLDVERDFSFTYELRLDSDEINYFSIDLIDFGDEVSVIGDYGDNIKDIDIRNISFWIKNHQGPNDQIIVESSLSVANFDGTNPVLVSNLENQEIATLIQNPTALDLNQDGVQKLNRLIRQTPHTLQFILMGQLDQAPANFTAVFEFEGRMTANPL